jgi:hypothetical protein
LVPGLSVAGKLRVRRSRLEKGAVAGPGVEHEIERRSQQIEIHRVLNVLLSLARVAEDLIEHQSKPGQQRGSHQNLEDRKSFGHDFSLKGTCDPCRDTDHKIF